MNALVEAKIIKDHERLKEFYKLRYDVFVAEQRAAPESFYSDGQLKDAFDDEGIHIGCYLNNRLVGTLSLIIKKDDLLMVEKVHSLKSDTANKYAEAMRLIIVDGADTKKMSIKAVILSKMLTIMKEVIASHEITHVYLQSSEKGKKIYEHMGFEQIGEFKMYEGISNECPMILDVEKFKINILQGV